jgi:hypothetical protein
MQAKYTKRFNWIKIEFLFKLVRAIRSLIIRKLKSFNLLKQKALKFNKRPKNLNKSLSYLTKTSLAFFNLYTLNFCFTNISLGSLEREKIGN